MWILNEVELVEYLLTLLDYNGLAEGVGGNGGGDVGHLFVVKGYTALCDKASCLTLGCGKLYPLR